MKKIKKLFALLGITLILAASGVLGSFTANSSFAEMKPVQASTATVYTQTQNADGFFVNAPDAYEPGSTYDTIGLNNPQDIFIDTEEVNGQTIDYAYILNSVGADSFLLKINLSAENPQASVENIPLNFSALNTPTGLWIQEIEGIKYLYIADAKATHSEERYRESYIDENGQEKDRAYTFTGFIYVAPLDNLSQYKVITEPMVLQANNFVERAPSFGSDDLTKFDPQKIAVDQEGKIYVASPATSSGMILLSNSYLDSDNVGLDQKVFSEFISFFAVNNVRYSLLYYLVRTFGTDEQLSQIDIPIPAGFTNVYIDSQNIVYSMTTKAESIKDDTSYPSMTKHKTDGSTIYNFFSTTIVEYTDIVVTSDGITFMSDQNGMIVVLGPQGEFIYMFGSNEPNQPEIVGFFSNLIAIGIDSSYRIWAVDQERNLIQSFNPTNYSQAIFRAMISFENHQYEESRQAWEEVLQYDELSVFANDGLGKAYYYDLDFEEAARYFSISKNRTLYSEAFWEIRNTWLQDNLPVVIVIAVAAIAIIVILYYLFKTVPAMVRFKKNVKKVKEKRFIKDLLVGFRVIRHPVDTFYEIKTNRRGSVLGATIYYLLGLVIFVWYMYGKALPFQYFNENTLNSSIVIFGYILVLFIFVLCNYLVSAIKNGEGTFKNIYKFTGYSLLPLIICLPIAVGLSYILTLTEQVIMDLLFQLALWGSIFYIIIGILETHNYTFRQTFWNVILTLIFMILFVIICLTVLLMFDQVSNLVDSIIKEVKLRAGWY